MPSRTTATAWARPATKKSTKPVPTLAETIEKAVQRARGWATEINNEGSGLQWPFYLAVSAAAEVVKVARRRRSSEGDDVVLQQVIRAQAAMDVFRELDAQRQDLMKLWPGEPIHFGFSTGNCALNTGLDFVMSVLSRADIMSMRSGAVDEWMAKSIATVREHQPSVEGWPDGEIQRDRQDLMRAFSRELDQAKVAAASPSIVAQKKSMIIDTLRRAGRRMARTEICRRTFGRQQDYQLFTVMRVAGELTHSRKLGGFGLPEWGN